MTLPELEAYVLTKEKQVSTWFHRFVWASCVACLAVGWISGRMHIPI